MKKIILSAAAFAAMTTAAMADPGATDAVMGAAAHNAGKLSDAQMSTILARNDPLGFTVNVATPVNVVTPVGVNVSVLGNQVNQRITFDVTQIGGFR